MQAGELFMICMVVCLLCWIRVVTNLRSIRSIVLGAYVYQVLQWPSIRPWCFHVDPIPFLRIFARFVVPDIASLSWAIPMKSV